jgi:putative transposase
MALRREYLDHVIFWNRADLLRKLGHFASYYNEARAHSALAGRTPSERRGHPSPAIVDLRQFSWQARCRGLFQTPIAA